MRQGAAGTLPEAAITVGINGVTLTPGTAATFDSGVDLAWTVTSTQGIPYKGIFVRVQAGDDNAFTLTGDGLAISALCDVLTENVIGVSHTTSAAKTTNSGVINFSGTGSVSMDVTLVFDNVVTSVYASSNFPLTIGGDAPVAPVAPVPTPGTTTESPAGIPTAPVPAEPTAPVPATTPAPAAAPTDVVPTEPTPTAPTAPTTDECPDDGKGKGKGGESGKGKGGESGKGKGKMKCKGGMMMGMETKSPKSPKTPKADEPKSTKAPKEGKGGEGKGKGDARRYLK